MLVGERTREEREARLRKLAMELGVKPGSGCRVVTFDLSAVYAVAAWISEHLARPGRPDPLGPSKSRF